MVAGAPDPPAPTTPPAATEDIVLQPDVELVLPEASVAVVAEDTLPERAFVEETSSVLAPTPALPPRQLLLPATRLQVPPPPAIETQPEDLEGSLPPPRRDYLPDAGALSTFEDLGREIEAYLAGSNGSAGVALWRQGEGLIYGHNVDELFPLASVVKVHVMLAYLDAVLAEERDLSAKENQLLEWMITYSDNESADMLWGLLGNGRVAAYLKGHHLPALPMIIPEDGYGATTMQSPRQLAVLFARLYAGDLLSPEATAYALSLLGRIDPSQIWGVTAGLRGLQNPPAVYMKDGWFPGPEGWRINSAGIVIPVDGHAPYVLVLLADGQPGYRYGVETVETIAALINGMLLSGPPAGLSAYP
jgi:beta-lactamase class A